MTADARLRDAIAAAIRVTEADVRSLTDAIFPLVVAEVRSAAEKAWTEGWFENYRVHNEGLITAGNPYRVEGAGPAGPCCFPGCHQEWNPHPIPCPDCALDGSTATGSVSQRSAARVDEPATPPADWISDFDDEDK